MPFKHVVALGISLLGTIGSASADWAITNKLDRTVVIASGPGENTRAEVAPGGSINIAQGGFSAIAGQGLSSGTCKPDVRFEVIKDASVTWAFAPKVIAIPK